MASENSLVRLIQSLTVQLDLWTLLLLERRIRPAYSFRPPANLVAVRDSYLLDMLKATLPLGRNKRTSRTVLNQPQKMRFKHVLSHG